MIRTPAYNREAVSSNEADIVDERQALRAQVAELVMEKTELLATVRVLSRQLTETRARLSAALPDSSALGEKVEEETKAAPKAEKKAANLVDED